MKLNKVVFLLFTAIFIVSSFSMVNVAVASTSSTNANYENTSSNQCTSPTKTLNIQGQAQDRYNVTSFSVAPGTCLAVSFRDVDTLDHSFTINAITASNVAYFTIYDKPNQVQTVNFQAPSANMTIKYYCAVPGHEQNGMYGYLTVGTVSSSSASKKSTPGFEAMSVFIGLIGAVGLVSIYRKRRN